MDEIRRCLENCGVSIWQDARDLRSGDNWEAKIHEYISGSTTSSLFKPKSMDRRDYLRKDGVYNAELSTR